MHAGARQKKMRVGKGKKPQEGEGDELGMLWSQMRERGRYEPLDGEDAKGQPRNIQGTGLFTPSEGTSQN
jgi:hypothetical protein